LSVAFRNKGLAINTARPIVSFTFDDAPRSSANIGANILESAGLCGTFYVAGSLCGSEQDGRPYLSPDDLVTLHRHGHELACHTYSHCLVSTLTSTELDTELKKNQAFISELCGDVHLSNFAYPFGDVSLRRKRQLQAIYSTCRGIVPGVNSGIADLGLLKAVALYSVARKDHKVQDYLDQASKERGWLIFYTHDVDQQPSAWGASIDQFEHAVAGAVERGYEVLTVRNAIGRLAIS
jgi:peptidoglycan/xylan/chitin deacetylase (PgdA/CDA1 family)